ncbi:receptor activity-modifying protein 1-like [Eublepharis macularius]|uniref:Receptor activity-modifying protein 1-like n=1 Tax=Eublepharis macularius TaxID=481883 RepID=A0AA97LEU7_EUBMA|nr:receptor activity-modifying protein 1-like [Eublepharis macularius]
MGACARRGASRSRGEGDPHVGLPEEENGRPAPRLPAAVACPQSYILQRAQLTPGAWVTGGCAELTYGDPEDETSYLYPDEEELFEEENQASDCGNGYYDQIALFCWPKFHATIMATAEDRRCLWETIGSMYSELTICAGLLAKSMGCPLSSPTLDAFFVSIHTEYFASCTLNVDATDHQLPTGAIIVLAALPVCLVPLSVALTLHRA